MCKHLESHHHKCSACIYHCISKLSRPSCAQILTYTTDSHVVFIINSLFTCRIYVDIVINHMTASHSHDDEGSDGSHADTIGYSYPAVPYTKEDFNLPACAITNEDWCSAEKVN